ncbi:MAG: AMP-binding protein [Gammaproteobacteria bacterium]|nr:AMP-binding protein [Gammaproteobacteria bacterium]
MIEGWYEETNRTWGNVLADTAERYPQAEFVVYREQRVTYANFYEQVQRCARGLLSVGVRRGDNVALWMTNCVEWLVVQFAAYAIGAPLIPVNTRLKPDELCATLRQSRASTLVFKRYLLGDSIDTLPWLERMIPGVDRAGPQRMCAPELPELKRLICCDADVPRGALAYAQILETGQGWECDADLRRAAARVNPFDVANIVYTSGTTGAPKGGLSMHRNNMAALYHWIERTALGPGDRVYLGVPLATNFGCAYVSQLSVMAGSTIVMHESFEPRLALRAIESERITWFPGAPTMYIMMLGSPELGSADLSSLRTAIVGGAPCTPATIGAMKERMGFRFVVQCYGLSECAGLSTSTFLDDPIEKTATTVGKPFPSCRLRIVNADTLRDAEPGEPGEIWLHDAQPGSCVGKGYFEMPAAANDAITADGWFRTGDVGSFDEDGYLRLCGRIKDMYIVGGFNAYPAEIEAVLHTHPKIRMAQVFGVPHERLGEVGCACVELEPEAVLDGREVIAFCQERMANYKVPRHVRFLRGTEFPLTSSGKVRKLELRQRVARDLGIEV